MSLLNQGTHTVTVFAEVTTTDEDGSRVTKPGTAGVNCRARIQPLSSTEDGDGTLSKYQLRLIGWKSDPLGPRSSIEWEGKRYAIDGEPLVYNSSRRTAHVEYTMIRR